MAAGELECNIREAIKVHLDDGEAPSRVRLQFDRIAKIE